jgi:hypothetical protein
LRCISSCSVRLIAATIVTGSPCGDGAVSKASDEGSTSGEYTYRPAVSGAGRGAFRARSAASVTSASTSLRISSSSFSVASPSERRSFVRTRMGSRAASSSRSSAVL